MTVWCAGLNESHPNAIIFVNNQLGVQFFSCMFISILYKFRAAMCPSSGELSVSIRHLVCQSVAMSVWCAVLDETADSSKPAHQTIIYTEWHILDLVLIQLILLMMGTWLPETSRECK